MASELWRCRNKKCCDDAERMRCGADGIRLLDRQIRRSERDFINEGGFRERMARVRRQQCRARATPPSLRKGERLP
jgi:four helix bundle suffix protein